MMIAWFGLGATDAPAAEQSLVPQAVRGDGWRRQWEFQRDQLTVARADLCFMGDSITEDWSRTGRMVWERTFRNLRKVNCGLSGDRAENLLWRIQHYDLSKREPRGIVLLIGTNNLSKEIPDPPVAVADAIEACVRHILKVTMETRTLVLSILPNGYQPDTRLRRDIMATNRLTARLGEMERVRWPDMHDSFLDPAGRWKADATLDGTHLSASGYEFLRSFIQKEIEWLLDGTQTEQATPARK